MPHHPQLILTPIEHQSSTLVLFMYLVILTLFHDRQVLRYIMDNIPTLFSRGHKKDSDEADDLDSLDEKDKSKSVKEHIFPTALLMLFWVDFIFLYLDMQVRYCLYER